jgi:hypothetical protein
VIFKVEKGAEENAAGKEERRHLESHVGEVG